MKRATRGAVAGILAVALLHFILNTLYPFSVVDVMPLGAPFGSLEGSQPAAFFSISTKQLKVAVDNFAIYCIIIILLLVFPSFALLIFYWWLSPIMPWVDGILHFFWKFLIKPIWSRALKPVWSTVSELFRGCVKGRRSNNNFVLPPSYEFEQLGPRQ